MPHLMPLSAKLGVVTGVLSTSAVTAHGQSAESGHAETRARAWRARETMLPAQWRAVRALLLVPTLDARLLQKLAVLLLRHTLATLLDD
jgi:hypothetical protein